MLKDMLLHHAREAEYMYLEQRHEVGWWIVEGVFGPAICIL